MIAQQRRVSKTRKLKRRTHYKIEVPGMSVCPNCGELKLSHRVCPVCGYYNKDQNGNVLNEHYETKEACVCAGKKLATECGCGLTVCDHTETK